MPKKTHDVFYKFSVVLKWPQIARNRSIDTLQERPDIVQEMNHFRQKIENVLNLIVKKEFSIDDAFNMNGVRIRFSSGQDLYEFIIRQPEFEWEIIPQIGTVNQLTGEFENFDLEYTPQGISIP